MRAVDHVLERGQFGRLRWAVSQQTDRHAISVNPVDHHTLIADEMARQYRQIYDRSIRDSDLGDAPVVKAP